MIRFENIRKSYKIGKAPRIEVLKGVSGNIGDGEFISISGPSGCGKSTLLHLLGGLDTPDAGDVFWRQRSLRKSSGSELATWRNRSVGFIFQAYHLLPELDTLENVLLPASLARINASKKASELLGQVGLAHRLGHRPSELSGGEQQRAAIARALINDPEVIFADEPTGNLDEATAEEIMHLLLDLTRQRKKALVLVTHNRELALRAEVRYRLSDGHLEKE